MAASLADPSSAWLVQMRRCFHLLLPFRPLPYGPALCTPTVARKRKQSPRMMNQPQLNWPVLKVVEDVLDAEGRLAAWRSQQPALLPRSGP